MSYTVLFSGLTSHVSTLVVAGGYPLLFLLILLEGIPVVGMLVPGHVAIIAAGFFIRLGVFNVWAVIVLGVVAAVCGDFIGFKIGEKYGLSFIDRLKPYFFITDLHIEKAQALVAKHTGLAMIGGRFSPVTRPLTPFLVGASTIKIKRFWLYNIIGGASWVIASVIIGYAFGEGYSAGAEYFGKGVLIALLCTVIILWGYRFVNKRFHVFRRYELFALILNLLSLWALARTIQDAWSAKSFLANFDVAVNVFVSQHITPFMQSIATLVTNSGGTVAVSVVAVIISILYAKSHRFRSSAIMLMSIGSTAVLTGVMKELFMRARPNDALQVLTDPSFPSGHAAFAAAFFLVLAYLLTPRIHSWVKRELLIVGCVLAAIAIGLSRIVLNVHWASDVIAGWAVGVFCATASILFIRYVGKIIMPKDEIVKN